MLLISWLVTIFPLPDPVMTEISQSEVLVVDASKVTEDTGKTLAEVLGIAQTRAITMPTQVWDWSNGNYDGAVPANGSAKEVKTGYPRFSKMANTVFMSIIITQWITGSCRIAGAGNFTVRGFGRRCVKGDRRHRQDAGRL